MADERNQPEGLQLYFNVNALNKDLVQTVLRDINVLLIMPFWRSGSILLQSLFDDHPQVISFPYWHKYYGYITGSGVEADLNDFIGRNPSMFSSRGSYLIKEGPSGRLLGDNWDEHFDIDLEKFRSAFLEMANLLDQERIDNRTFLVLMHLALAVASGTDITQLKFICFHYHAVPDSGVTRLSEDFPDLYFIAMLRDPRESWLGWRSVATRRTENLSTISELLRTMDERETTFARFIELHRGFSNLKIVDLNWLHIEQGKAMRALAEWLQVDYLPSLCRSTFMGLTWWGNSANQAPINGFDRAKADYRYEEKLPEIERQIIEFFFLSVITNCRYQIPSAKLSRAKMLSAVFLRIPAFRLGDARKSSVFQDFILMAQRLRFRYPVLGKIGDRLPTSLNKAVAFVTAVALWTVFCYLNPIWEELKTYSIRRLLRMSRFNAHMKHVDLRDYFLRTGD